MRIVGGIILFAAFFYTDARVIPAERTGNIVGAGKKEAPVEDLVTHQRPAS